MRLIAGLGNIGSEYDNTRHNIGFSVVDDLALKYRAEFEKNGNYLMFKKRGLYVIKPLTYMNLSGKAINKAMHAESFEEILVIVDDINLPLGQIRLRKKGSDGGHNGLKSIIEELNTANFARLRIGVGKPEKTALKNFVLGNFDAKENEILQHTSKYVLQLIEMYRKSGFQAMVNYYSKTKESYSDKITEDQDLRPQEEKW